MQAELCFNQVIQSEKQIKYDSYLVPFTMYELGLLYKQQDEREKAIRYIETAKNNYKEYSMESRLHFRIHAALDSLKVSPASTPWMRRDVFHAYNACNSLHNLFAMFFKSSKRNNLVIVFWHLWFDVCYFFRRSFSLWLTYTVSTWYFKNDLIFYLIKIT